MFKKIFFSLILIIIFSIFLSPFPIDAMGLYFEKPIEKIKAGESFTLKVYFDSEDKEVNVLEGSFKTKGEVNILSVDKESSIFSVWPEEPRISASQISFVGGTPGGVFGKDLKVFNIVIFPTADGVVSIKSNKMATYLNDGIGTKIKIAPVKFEIQVGENLKVNWNLFWAIIILFVVYYFYRIFRNIKKTKK